MLVRAGGLEFRPPECGSLNSVYDNSCTPLLPHSTLCSFKLRHLCANDELSSPWSAYSEPMSTIVIKPPGVAFAMPTERVKQPPADLLLLFDTTTQLVHPPEHHQAEVCPLGTMTPAGDLLPSEDDDACGDCFLVQPVRYGPTAYQLIGPGLATVVEMCGYEVRVPEALVRRTRPPLLNNTAYTFAFRYVPELPVILSLRLVLAKPDSLRVGAVFGAQEAMEFECAARGAVATGTAVSYMEVEFLLTGLYPLQSYQVECVVRLRNRPRVISAPSTPKFLSTAEPAAAREHHLRVPGRAVPRRDSVAGE